MPESDGVVAVGDGVYYRMQHHQGDGDLGDVASVEDRAESLPPEAESIVDDLRREKFVTQFAVHSASDDLPTRAWQAGDATQPSVCTPYDPKVAQQPTTLGRHVTVLYHYSLRQSDSGAASRF